MLKENKDKIKELVQTLEQKVLTEIRSVENIDIYVIQELQHSLKSKATSILVAVKLIGHNKKLKQSEINGLMNYTYRLLDKAVEKISNRIEMLANEVKNEL